MPDAALVLNAGSGGDSLDTWQDPTSSRKAQYVSLKMDRGGVLYVANSAMISWAATASLRPWALFNPSGSGKTVYVRWIQATLWASAAATVIPVQMTRITGLATTGTTITAARLDNAALSGNVAAVRSLATAAAPAGTFVGRAMVTPATALAYERAMIWESYNDRAQMLPVAPNEALVWQVTGTPDADIRSWIDIFYEEV